MSDGLRLDKWLWHARFFKTRTLSAAAVKSGRVRVNGARVDKPAHAVRIGDGLTIMQGARSRVARVAAFGSRRGPASEAATLYEDLAPPPAPKSAPESQTESAASDLNASESARSSPCAPGSGSRPDKRGRRAISALKTGFTDG